MKVPKKDPDAEEELEEELTVSESLLTESDELDQEFLEDSPLPEPLHSTEASDLGALAKGKNPDAPKLAQNAARSA